MKSFPKVFVIILNYNGKDFIKKCLASVFKIDYPNFEVIVVDNNSTDGSLESARANFSKAHFIKNEANLGIAAGNNIGIRFALERMADYVILLNQDTEVEKDFLERLVDVAENDPGIGLISPIIFNGFDKKIWFSGGEVKWLRNELRYTTKAVQSDSYKTDFISSCAMLIKKETFKSVGLLDEDYFLYYEDADFSLKAKREGLATVVVTGSWVYHFKEKKELSKNKNYWLIVSSLIFFKKNSPSLFRPWIRAYTFLRKTRNLMEVVLKNGESVKNIRKAYVDFEKLTARSL